MRASRMIRRFGCLTRAPYPSPRFLRKRVGLLYSIGSNAFGLLLLLMTAFPARPQSGSYRIAGTVVNATDGTPVPHATVAILTVADSHAVASVQSGPDGHFAFAHLPAAKYALTVSRRGFLTAFYDDHGDYSTSIVTGSRNPSNVDPADLVFRLAPGAVIRGVVTDDGGDPVAGANVRLYRKLQTGESGSDPAGAGLEITDDAGAYEFSGLDAGTYFVAIEAKPWYAMRPAANASHAEPSAEAAALDVAYPVTYFDSTTDEASATPMVLAAGDRQQADVNLHAVPALRIDASATPHLRQMIFGNAMPVDSQASIAPGRYELNGGDPPRVAVMNLTEGGQLDPNAGSPAVAVTGTMQTEPGETLPANTVLTLKPLDTGEGQVEMEARLDRGRFSFPAVLPGAWELEAVGGGTQLPVVALAINGKQQVGNRLVVEDHALSVVAQVRPGSGRVDGFTRKDGKSFAGAMIVLVPEDLAQIEELARRDQSDSDGSFSLLDAVPGSYTVVAIEDGWDLDWSRPEVISRYLAGGVPVTVPAGSPQPVELSRPVPVQFR